MLIFDPKLRIKPQQALQHTFFRKLSDDVANNANQGIQGGIQGTSPASNSNNLAPNSNSPHSDTNAKSSSRGDTPPPISNMNMLVSVSRVDDNALFNHANTSLLHNGPSSDTQKNMPCMLLSTFYFLLAFSYPSLLCSVPSFLHSFICSVPFFSLRFLFSLWRFVQHHFQGAIIHYQFFILGSHFSFPLLESRHHFFSIATYSSAVRAFRFHAHITCETFPTPCNFVLSCSLQH